MKLDVWMIAIAALASLGACQGPPGGSVADEAALASNAASEAAVVAAQAAKPPIESPTPIKADMAKTESAAAPAKPDLCWQDYCPCVQPVTALDRTICRNARAGIEMSDDQWAIGAQARDMKIESDELTRQADEGIAEINANRIYDRGD